MAISFTFAALIYFIVFFLRIAGINSLDPIYLGVMSLLGVAKALIFSNLLSVLAEWFTKKNRGLILGVWLTA